MGLPFVFGRKFRGSNTKVHFEPLEPRVLLSGGATGDSIYVLSKPNLPVADTNIGTSGQAFVVEIIKPDGTIDTSYDGTVSISASNFVCPTGPGDGTVTGTLSVSAQNGVATFNDLTFTTSGNYNAQFTDDNGDPQMNVAEIYYVSPAGTTPVNEPSQLRFIEEPNVDITGVFSVTLAIEDANGNPVANGNTIISLSIYNGPEGAVLSSITGDNQIMANPNGPDTIATATVDSNGLATFVGLGVNIAGSYTLEATVASPLSMTLSDPFQAQALPVVAPPAPTPIIIVPLPIIIENPVVAAPSSKFAAPAIASNPISPRPNPFAAPVSIISHLTGPGDDATGGLSGILDALGSSPSDLLKNL